MILITSAIPAEGKTTLSMNLAASFVQQGKTVLLLEADMRRPAIRSSMGLPGRSGLSLLLAGESQENAIFAHPQCRLSSCRRERFRSFPLSYWSPIVCAIY